MTGNGRKNSAATRATHGATNVAAMENVTGTSLRPVNFFYLAFSRVLVSIPPWVWYMTQTGPCFCETGPAAG